MLVLSVEENRSVAGEMVLVCWVFEGIAHKGDKLTHAARYNVWIYGRDTATHNLLIRYELEGMYPIQLTIQRIRKHRDWPDMPAGYSGLFNFQDSKLEDWSLVGEVKTWQGENRQATLSNPISYSKLCLFESESSAHIYTEKILKENNFMPF